MHNFSFDSHGICVNRSWKIGNGKFIAFSALETPRSINTINCSDTHNGKTLMFATGQPRTEQRNPSNRSTDVRKDTNISRLFECYEEGCVKTFSYQGNLVNHLGTGKHYWLPERVPLWDTGMQIFASKLERIGQRELVSIVLQSNYDSNKQKSHTSNLVEGWALPKVRKISRLTSKQVDYLTIKFNDGITNNKRWKP